MNFELPEEIIEYAKNGDINLKDFIELLNYDTLENDGGSKDPWYIFSKLFKRDVFSLIGILENHVDLEKNPHLIIEKIESKNFSNEELVKLAKLCPNSKFWYSLLRAFPGIADELLDLILDKKSPLIITGDSDYKKWLQERLIKNTYVDTEKIIQYIDSNTDNRIEMLSMLFETGKLPDHRMTKITKEEGGYVELYKGMVLSGKLSNEYLVELLYSLRYHNDSFDSVRVAILERADITNLSSSKAHAIIQSTKNINIFSLIIKKARRIKNYQLMKLIKKHYRSKDVVETIILLDVFNVKQLIEVRDIIKQEASEKDSIYIDEKILDSIQRQSR